MASLQSHRALWAVTAWALYIAVWPFGHGAFFSDLFTAFAFGPLLFTAWLYGRRGAALAAALFVPLQVGLFLASDHGLGWDAFAGREGAAGMAVMVVVTLFVGWAADSNRRMRSLLRSQADLIAVVSHEVRTPLTGVVGLAKELQQSWAGLPEPMRRELVDLISQSAEEMASIVEDLLTAAKAEQGSLLVEPGVADLPAIAASVVDQLRLDVAVVGEASAWADPGRVRQVIRNLVVNAHRYGGPEIRLQAGVNGSQVWLEVSDNGRGVPAEMVERLFLPTGADHRNPDSNGLGLPLSHTLAILMGGALTYRRQQNASVFRFALPKAVVAVPAESLDQVRVGR